MHRPRILTKLSGKKLYAYPVHSSCKYRKPCLLGYRQGLSSKHWFVNKTWSSNDITLQNGYQIVQWIGQIILANKKYETMEWLHTSTGIVSPGRTNIESPTRTSSTGTSIVIASEFKIGSEEGSPLEEVTINLDWGDNRDCHRTPDVISFK